MVEGPSANADLPNEMAEEFRRFGRARARQYRETIETAIGYLAEKLTRHDADRTTITEAAAQVEASVPQRHREEAMGMAEALAVPSGDLRTYMFGTSEFQAALAPAEASHLTDHSEGCSNVIVPAGRSTTGTPLMFKNRDVKSRSVRPQVVLEVPELGPYNGFLTMTTAGNVLVYQGINTAGLAVANTFVDNSIEDVPPEERLRNGTLVRDLLERCNTVEETVARVMSLPVERSKGLTLFLSDGTDIDLLEVDSLRDRIESIVDGVTPRTNHFLNDAGGKAGRSSTLRLRRLRELLDDLPPNVSPAALDRVARDHRHGPGPNSVCRHPTTGGDLNTHTESTTVSSMVFVGGERQMRAVQGNPCERRPVTYELRDHSLSEFEEHAGLGEI